MDQICYRLMETLIPNNGGNILTFSSNGKKKRSQKEENVVMWPVVARTKPLISRPNIILDLPDIRSNVLCKSYLNFNSSTTLMVPFSWEYNGLEQKRLHGHSAPRQALHLARKVRQKQSDREGKHPVRRVSKVGLGWWLFGRCVRRQCHAPT